MTMLGRPYHAVTRLTLACSGAAVELPEHLVPSAYREWDVKVFDWQTLCSVRMMQDKGMQYMLKRMMPTVGVRGCTRSAMQLYLALRHFAALPPHMLVCNWLQCEADAVAFTEEAQAGLSGPSSALPVLADGSYVLAPMALLKESRQLRLETCLAGAAGALLAARTRTRVVHFLRQTSESEHWHLSKVEVPLRSASRICSVLPPDESIVHHVCTLAGPL